MRSGWNTRLRSEVQRGDSRAGLIAEVVQIVDSSVKGTIADWAAGTTTGDVGGVPFGGVTLGSTSAGVVTQTSDDGTQVTGLSQTAPFDTIIITWMDQGSEDREIENIIAHLDPRADGGEAKTVDRFVCQLFRVTDGGTPGSDTEVVPISIPVSVEATGEVAADFTFDFRRGDGSAPRVGPAPRVASRPRTLVRIWAMTSTGAAADNVAWLADSAITTHVSSTYSVTHHVASEASVSIGTGGSTYLIGPTVENMPRFTVNRAGYSAGEVDFTGANAVPDLPGDGDLVIVARGQEPSDSSLTFYIDDGSSGDVECVDGDVIGQDNTALGGSDLSGVSTTGPWDIRVELAPSSDGFRAPTVREFGVERVVSTFLAGAAEMSGGASQVDPLTLKANIPRAQCRVVKSGEKDYDDYGSRILAGNHIGDVAVRIWVGDLSGQLPRRYWMLHSTWDVDDYVNAKDAHVIDLLSPLRRLRRPIPRFVPTTGNDGTREPLVYADDIAAVYSDLIANIAELAGRLIGDGCTDTSTQIAKTITEADLKDELDSVAYQEGRAVTESQGRIRAVQVMRDDFGADTPVLHFPVGSYDPITIGPGFTARTDEVFVRYGWNTTDERYEDERRHLNATALGKLGGVGLNTTHQVDDRIVRWITTEAQADAVGRRIVNHFFSGLILWRIKSHVRNPQLEIGDVVSITTDQFVGRNPITDAEIRGPLSTLAIVARVGNFEGTDLDLWVPGYEFIVVGEGTTTPTGFGEPPEVKALTVAYNGDGDAFARVLVEHAASVRVLDNASAFPDPSGETAVNVDSDGWAEVALSTGYSIGDDVYISVIAYELVAGGGLASPRMVAKATRPDPGEIIANQMSAQAQRFATDLVFSASDDDTVAWTEGTVTLANGDDYSIASGNTGDMAALTFIYLDIDTSTTALQTSTTFGDAVGDNKILLCTAKPAAAGTQNAFYVPAVGVFGINEEQISANAISADKIQANAITAGKLAAASVEAISIAADAITADKISANSIDVQHLRVGGENLIRNPGFEVSDTLMTPWREVVSQGTWTITATDPRSGSYCLRHDPAGMTGVARVENGTAGSRWEATEGDQFYFRTYYQTSGASVANDVEVRIIFRNAAGTSLQEDTTVGASGSTSYQPLEVTGTAPAGTTQVCFELRVQNDGQTGIRTFDDCLARRMVDGVIVTGKLLANVIVASESFTAPNPVFEGVAAFESGEGATRVEIDSESAGGGLVRLYDASSAIAAQFYVIGNDATLEAVDVLTLRSVSGSGVVATGGPLQAAAVHVGTGASGSPPSNHGRLYTASNGTQLWFMAPSGATTQIV